MNKPRGFFKDTYHHLYNRGANKQKIFIEEENYLYFLRRLKFYSDKYQILLLTYCLMPNHFHIFVKQTSEYLSISDFISSLLNSYTKSFNKRYGHSGTLLESKIKSKQIENEYYFKWVIKYILENPVKSGLVNSIDEWNFSNAKDLLGIRTSQISNVEEISSYFQSVKVMREFLSDGNIRVCYDF